MTEPLDNLVCAWWNCKLSPPKNGAKTNPMTAGFWLAVHSLLSKGADILGLCEVGRDHANALVSNLEKEGLTGYKVIDLYTPGKSIDDFCLIYDARKLELYSVLSPANSRDPLTNEWLKAGVFVEFKMLDGRPLYVGLSHWQSRRTHHEGSPIRFKLGEALRTKISELKQNSPNALIILCGDYNDEPYSESLVHGLGASRDALFVQKKPNYFFNPFWSCLGFYNQSTPPGTYIHTADNRGSGGAVYDQIMFSANFLNSWRFEETGMIVGDIPVAEIGMRWSEVSDHYPVLSHLVRGTI